MVGEIAERFLTVATRAQIAKLLEADRMADDQPSDRHTLGEVANWADEIKDTDWGKRRGSWHYDDVRSAGRGLREVLPQRAMRFRATRRQIEILGNERARPGQRNEASNGSCI